MTNRKTLLLLLCAGVLVSNAQENLKTLDQGKLWTADIRQRFWFIDQGSKLMPARWFSALGCPINPKVKCTPGTKLKDNLSNYGFIMISPPADQALADKFWDINPDGLPIGFATHTDSKGTDQNIPYIGLTCAACHTARIDFPGQGALLIEGGPSKIDFDNFFADVLQALHETVDNSARRAQFETAVSDPHVDHKIRQRMTVLDKRKSVNTPTIAGGFGRLDAFGQIFNQIAVVALGDEGAGVPPDAHASFPCLWDISQHKFVQWNGSIPNLGDQGTGSLLRNIGEVLGTFGDLDVKDGNWAGVLPKYQSSINAGNLRTIESWISGLQSPPWPGEKLSPSDASFQNGGNLYHSRCEGCHAIISRDRHYAISVKMIPVDEVQTDPLHANNFRLRRAKAGPMARHESHTNERRPFAVFGDTALVKDLVGNASVGAYAAAESPGSWRNLVDLFWGLRVGVPDLNRYKARPLNGIWATAPYLHNGSVPSLTELLKPPKDRVPQFCVGSDSYDIGSVGYISPRPPCGDRQFLFDTRLRGNSNLGHAYGTDLSYSEKQSLIEYLKTL